MGTVNDADGSVARVDSDGSLAVSLSEVVDVSDDFTGGEVLNDQTGADSVLTFTFAAPRSLLLIQAVGDDLVARADPFGGNPTAIRGIRCDDSTPTYLPVRTSQVKIYTPNGMVVSVAGFSRT